MKARREESRVKKAGEEDGRPEGSTEQQSRNAVKKATVRSVAKRLRSRRPRRSDLKKAAVKKARPFAVTAPAEGDASGPRRDD